MTDKLPNNTPDDKNSQEFMIVQVPTHALEKALELIHNSNVKVGEYNTFVPLLVSLLDGIRTGKFVVAQVNPPKEEEPTKD